MPADESDEMDESDGDPDFIPGPDDHPTDSEDGDDDPPEDDPGILEPDQPEQTDQGGVDANNNVSYSPLFFFELFLNFEVFH